MNEEKPNNTNVEKPNLMPKKEKDRVDNASHAEKGNKFGSFGKFMKNVAGKIIKRLGRKAIAITLIIIFVIWHITEPFAALIDTTKNLTLTNMGQTLPNASSSAKPSISGVLGGLWKSISGGIKSLLGIESDTDDREQHDYWVDLNEKSKFIIDKNTGENLAYIDENKEDDVKDILTLSRTAVMRVLRDELVEGLGKDTKLEDITQSQLAQITEKFFETGEVTPDLDHPKEYTIVDNYIKELGNQGISLRDLRLLGEANYDDMEKLLENEDNKQLVEKYISEFLRADIITQQPHRTISNDVVKIDKNTNYVDGGIYLWRTKKDLAYPSDKFNEQEVGTETEKEDDGDYIRMLYLPIDEFLASLRIEGWETEQKVRENIRNKKLKELLNGSEDGGRLSAVIETKKEVTEHLMYCFTQDPDTDDLIFIKIYQEQKANTALPEEDFPLKNIPKYVENKEPEYAVQLKAIPYKDKIAKYIMPYEFLINLCMITQNPEFVYHVALMARDTYIVLKIQDEETITRTTADVKVERGEDDTSIARDVTLTKEYNPKMQIRYANTWSWLEDFEHNKDLVITTWTTSEDVQTEEIEVETEEGETEEGETEEETITITTDRERKVGHAEYQEPVPINSIHKSQQFLGLLRNKTGLCEEDGCEKEEAWLNKQEPVALECVRKAKYDEEGVNVHYLIPGTTGREIPLNKLESGLELMYAMMQSNYSGYKENAKLISDLKDTYSKAKEFLEQGDEEEKNSQYNEGKTDYINAYVVKMQGTLEHLRYLMTFPTNEGDVVVQDPLPGSIYQGGKGVNCYTRGSGTSGRRTGYLGGSGDALWRNQISREEFVNIIKNFQLIDSSSGKAEGWQKFFVNYAEEFFDVATEYGLNPMYIVAMGVQESGWGSSQFANDRNNAFGIGAYDNDPNQAFHFDSPLAGIEYECQLLHDYASPGTWYYDSIQGMGLDPTSIQGQCALYATDPQKASSTYSVMETIFGDKAHATGDGNVSTTSGTSTSGSSSTNSESSSSTTTSGNQTIANWALEQVGKSEYYHGYKGTTAYSVVDGMGHCAEFAQAAIWEGTGYYMGGNAVDMKTDNYFSSDQSAVSSISEADIAKIPLGAYVRSLGSSEYQHVSIYVGDGYIVEAGGSVIQKNKLNVNDFGNGGYLGWTLITGPNGESSGSTGTSSSATGTYICVDSTTGRRWSSNSYSNINSIPPLAGEANDRIIQACKIVTETFLNRPGSHYSLDEGLIWGDIDRCFDDAISICCATYVSMVLRVAGVLTADQINAFNYHYTGGGGIPDMLEAAGWVQIDPSQAKPGDVVNNYSVHVMIYAGNGMVWDQNTCVGGRLGDPYPHDISGYQVWRAPESLSNALANSSSAETTATGTVAEYQAYAKQKLKEYGWSDSDFDCLVKLWEKESNWRVTATNPRSGAYGIPQSYPGEKMASAGSDWKTNYKTQINWGLSYIKERYGTPTAAWNFSQENNYY